MSGNSTLFTSDLPKIIPMARLYDPDVDVSSSVNTTKIIPTVNSLLVDDVYIYIVTAVNETTGKSTYRPLCVTDSNAVKRVFEYGNTFYALYFSKVQITDGTNHKLNLTRLNVDDKLTFFGDNVTNYDIIKTDATGKITIVSQYFNTEGINVGKTCKISGSSDYKKCVSCYSYEEFKAGESYTLRTYDSAGNLISSFVLIAVAATILSESIDSSKTIVDFYVRVNQYAEGVDDDDDLIYLYQNQNVDELKIWPIIRFADGSEEQVVIDNIHGFIYGLEEIKTDIIGNEYEVLVKYAIGSNVSSSIGTGAGDNRYLSTSFKVHIVDADVQNIAQISTIPEYDVDTNKWSLKGLVYYENRSVAPTPISPTVEGFNGASSMFGQSQTVDVSTSQKNIDGTFTIKHENLRIEVKGDPDSKTNPFLISYIGDEDERIFGNDRAPNDIPPQILYGEDSDGIVNYFIPKNTYVSTNFDTKVECFLHNFYFNANPPMIGDEAAAPTPTHFTIRIYENARPILAAPINVADFENALPLITSIANKPDQWVGTTVIVEFLKYNTSGTYDILYGVPVRIRPVPEE